MMYENPETLDDQYGNGAALPPEGSTNLRKAGKWGRFLGIVYMVSIGIGIGFIILFGGTAMTLAGMGSETGNPFASFMLPMLLFYGLFFAIMLYLAYLLYSFGAKAMLAVDQGDQTAMTASFGSLGRLFKILGILTIIQLAFMALSIVLFLFSGAAALLG
ncbi:hypothetical protein CLV84_3763 [Neolewinella xylanilytica]|uniref:Uncharacterized protein n=1 Tax=Neolewinella xylanilytica TaxID=1514080 RepID=A0A2S6I147_9BACT|nr:hypothetical protein [Neolewinella xylanilytica]PPK84601.1 hypothetical protein CLV84_3763 [Neolewinella xylanilytica]